MNAEEQAQAVIEEVIDRYGSRDPVFIAAKAGVRIVYENWQPVTVGEFDLRAKTIRVNRRAVDERLFSEAEIVAHELGHYFALGLNFDRKSEEAFAARFAASLLGQDNDGKS